MSQYPVSDLLQTFTRAHITSNYGFLFNQERNQLGETRPILTSFMLPHDFSVSMDEKFRVTGSSVQPSGAVSFVAHDPLPHKFNTTASLVDGILNLELEKRDGSKVACELVPGGRLDILLGFFKLN